MTAVDIVGRGLAFPLAVDDQGGVALVGGVDGIESALLLILSTAPGERVMRPAFGCRIWECVFGVLDASALGIMEYHAREAIALWEPRVDVHDIDATADPAEPGLVRLSIAFSVRASNDRRNLVFPFYVIPR